MKQCPSCSTATPLTAAFCPGCGHQFRTTFNPNQTQAIYNVPSAPTPPTFWQRMWNPMAQYAYLAELGAYMQATGQITPQHRKVSNAVMYLVYGCIAVTVIVFTWNIVGIFTQPDPFVEQMRRDQAKAAADMKAANDKYERDVQADTNPR